MPSTGHFILHSNVMPPVTAGKYQLRSSQTGVPFEVDEQVTHIHVAAPRYVMPTDQILSSFPPANAEGAFGDRLPQIVLKRRTLPWERNPAGGPDTSPTPWLALVVVAEGEAELSTATSVDGCFTPGLKVSSPDDRDVEQGVYLAVTETVVKKIFPREEDLPLLAHVREVDVHDTELAGGDDDGWLAVVLANRLPVFDQANHKSVRYLACLVNLEGQLGALPKTTPLLDHFKFELAQDWTMLATASATTTPDQLVLGGNRTMVQTPHDAPRDGARAVAGGAKSKLGVQLDGAAAMQRPAASKQWATTATAAVAKAALDPDARRMVRDTMGLGFRLPVELFAKEKVLRFPVLAHWSFTTNEGATFETLMQDLDVGLLGTVAEAPADAPMAKAGPETVQTGHIGLGHRTRRGDPAQAWYRGPCVPFPTPRDSSGSDAPLALAHSADQLRRIVPDGREDLGLAAAFEIGRLLALSQLSVVSALLRFRGEQFGAGRVRELLAQLLPLDLSSLSAQADLGRYVAVRALGDMARASERIIGPRRPVADPGRPLKVRGDLDKIVADGLGLDLAALRKQADQLGALAALQRTAAPLALKPGAAPSDKLVLPALQAALQDELRRTLDVAVPRRVATPAASKRGARAAAAAPQPDALDELLARLPADAEDTP